MIGLYLKQDQLVFPAGRDALLDPAPLIPGARMVKLTTSDGLALKGWYKPPVSGGPVVVYFHGNAGSLNARARRLDLLTVGGTGLMAVEYRGYAGNPGKPSETGLIRDAASAMTFLVAHGVTSDRIVLYGESLGTNVAIRTAINFPVAGVVLDSPYTSVANVAAKRYPYTLVRALIRNRFDTKSIIGALKVPLLVIRTTRDRIVSPEESLAVFQAAPEPKQVWTTMKGSHSTVIENGGLAQVERFIHRVTVTV